MAVPESQSKYLQAVREFCDPPTEYQMRKLEHERGRQLFLGDYLILDRLGQGAMSIVYKAVNRRNGEARALKLLAHSFRNDPARRMLMRREAKAVMTIRHPNVVRTYAVQVDHEPYYIAMELLEGQPLDRVLKQRKYLQPAEALAVGRLVAHALHAVHQAGFVHGDVKPGNIFIAGRGRVKLADFGLAHGHGQNEALRRHGYVLGTGYYLAPEVAGLKAANDIRSDIYSLGVVLYLMLTGIVPYPATTRQAALQFHQEADLPTYSLRNRGFPGELVNLVEKLLAKNPDDRYPTPRDVIDAFTATEQAIRSASNRA